LPLCWEKLGIAYMCGAQMRFADRPRSTADPRDRPASSGRRIPPGPMIVDRSRRPSQSGSSAAGTKPSVAQQSIGPASFGLLTRMPAKVWIAGGLVVLLPVLFFAISRSLLSEPTTRDDGASLRPKSDRLASTSAAMAPSHSHSDNDRRVIPIGPSTERSEQRPNVAVLIPRSTPPPAQASDPPPDAEGSPPWAAPAQSASEAAAQQLDLGQVEDAKRVQQRLVDLGFLFGVVDGAWGPRSRKALQDFKIANGMDESDTWDEATQERLLTAPDAIAAKIPDVSFIGGWGVDVAQCRESRLTISTSRAETSGAACEFSSTQRESSNVWRLRAQCVSGGERWNANIRFTISGNKLIWSSERGTTTYVRCAS
jgi:hypothetical protein